MFKSIMVAAIVLAFGSLSILNPDVASAQSSGRKGGDVRQKCYNDKGKPVDCSKLQQKK
jgi:hypothetical protein